jgi:hypothetical protein
MDMSEKNDGGPAFAQEVELRFRVEQEPAFPSHGSMGEVTWEGMTLRDYFAAKAMQAFVSREKSGMDESTYDETFSKWSYEIADAMLRARDA